MSALGPEEYEDLDDHDPNYDSDEFEDGTRTDGFMDMAAKAASRPKKIDARQLTLSMKNGEIMASLAGGKPEFIATLSRNNVSERQEATNIIGMKLHLAKVQDTSLTMSSLTRSVLSDWTIMRDKVLPYIEQVVADLVPPAERLKFLRIHLDTPMARLGSAYAPELIAALKARGYELLTDPKPDEKDLDRGEKAFLAMQRAALRVGKHVITLDVTYAKTMPWAK
jgi:hypothetical protein